jgi:hypothetical protein
VLVGGAVTSVVYGFVHAAEKGWGDISTVLPLAASAVLWIAPFAVDSRSAEPLLPAEIFTDRVRAGSFLNLLLLAAALTRHLIYLVQYLQNVLDLNALQSGLAILPFGVALLLTT